MTEISVQQMDTKLDTVEENANNYTHPTGNGNNHIPSGGATDQILKYSSAGTAQWGDASGGSRVLLSRSVMSSTSSYDFTAFNSSLYDSYVFEYHDIVPSNGGSSELQVYFSDDNQSSTLYVEAKAEKITSVTQSILNTPGRLRLAHSVGDSGKHYGCNVSGSFTVHNVHGAPTTSFSAEGRSTYRENSTAVNYMRQMCTADNNTSGNQKTVNNIRFKFNSGTMTQGIIKAYGVLKA